MGAGHSKMFLSAGVLLFLLWSLATGQSQTEQRGTSGYPEVVKQSYGLDQVLVNGFQYYNRYAGCRGVPYFGTVGFTGADLTIGGKEYRDVPIRYNLLTQRLELEYRSSYLGYNWMEVVTDHVEAFRILGISFRKMKLTDGDPLIYQEILAGPFSCYIHWEKDLQPIQNDQDYTQEFTRAEVTFLVEMNGLFYPVNNRRDFRNLFPEERRKEIGRMLKKNKFRINHASPDEMIVNMMQVGALFSQTALP